MTQARWARSRSSWSRSGIGEFLSQIQGGIPMSQGEMVRPADLGLTAAAVAARLAGPLEGLIAAGNEQRRARLVTLLRDVNDLTVGGPGADDELRRSARRCASSPKAK